MTKNNMMKRTRSRISLLSLWILSSCAFFASPAASSSIESSFSSDSSTPSSLSSSSSSSSFSSSSVSSYSSSSLQPGSFDEPQLVLDASTVLTWEENGFEGDGYAFRFQNVSRLETGFIEIMQGGYITNFLPFAKDILSVTVSFTSTEDYGSLLSKSSAYPISSPANGAYALTNEEVFTYSTKGSYFSLYAPLTSYDISSITLTFGESRSEPSLPKTIDIFTINDTHGAAAYASDNGKKQAGIRKLSSYLAEEERKNPDGSVVLSSGDMWQGGAESNLSKGRYFVDWMNLVGFESMAIGNHEFDWKADTIAKNAKAASFPFLGINILDPNGNRPSWAKPSVVLERGPYRIGVIGAIGPIASSIDSSSLSGYSFAWSNIRSLVQSEATRLRDNENCQLVLLSLHYSNTSDASSSIVWPGIDAVLEGHTHQSYGYLDAKGVPHVQTYANGSNLKKITFVYSESEHKLVYQSWSDIPFSTLSVRTDDPLASRLALHYEKESQKVTNEVLYHSTKSISKATLAHFAVRVLYEYYAEDSGSDSSPFVAALINTGSARQTLPAGDITYGDLLAALPFDNANIIASTSPTQLSSWLNNSYYSAYSISYDSSLSSVRFVTLSFVKDKLRNATTIEKHSLPVLRDMVATAFKEGKFDTYEA